MLTNKQLRHRTFHLIAAEGCPAPRRIPRKLKKAWKLAILREVRSRWPKETRPRTRLHWVPGDGWTLTVIKRANDGMRKFEYQVAP